MLCKYVSVACIAMLSNANITAACCKTLPQLTRCVECLPSVTQTVLCLRESIVNSCLSVLCSRQIIVNSCLSVRCAEDHRLIMFTTLQSQVLEKWGGIRNVLFWSEEIRLDI